MNSKMKFSPIPKFAFIGTSCSGKTTATYQTCAYLKERGIRVDGILQQDRRLPFDKEKLDTNIEAQMWFIANMLSAECYMSLQEGTDCVVSDRSLIDFFAYLYYQIDYQKHSGIMSGLDNFVESWASTYTKIFYLKPRPYDNDGVRPTDEFRLGVDKALKEVLDNYSFRNLVEVDSYEQAARIIAIETKKSLFTRDGIDPILTGSYSKGTETKKSDFDFVIDVSDVHLIKSELKEGLKQRPYNYVESIRGKYNDPDLANILYNDKYNVEIQVTRNYDKRFELEKAEVEQVRIEKFKEHLHERNAYKAMFVGKEMEGERKGLTTLFVKGPVKSGSVLLKTAEFNVSHLYLGAGMCSEIELCSLFLKSMTGGAISKLPITIEVDSAKKLKYILNILPKSRTVLVMLTTKLGGKFTGLSYKRLIENYLCLYPKSKIHFCVKVDDGEIVKVSKLTYLEGKLKTHAPVVNTFDGYPDDQIIWVDSSFKI